MQPATPSKQKNTEAILLAAREKLFQDNVPLMLRMVSFLRLSCAAFPEPGAYSKLMHALFQQDPAWWNTCEVTSTSLLQSSNPAINVILAPVLSLHQISTHAVAA